MAEPTAAPEIGVVDTAMEIESNEKRAREEDNVSEGAAKKQKVEEEKPSSSGPVKLGFKEFESSLDMFDYFFNFLHAWSPFLNVNKYEHIMLLELLKNGHTESDKKIAGGIRSFQVRKHPTWKSRCFFLIREDGSADDFSFRKCVDHILPLPEEMQLKPDVNRALGGSGRGKHRRGKGHNGRGRGSGQRGK
ncbi:hypothetical protein TanjilG_26332 [Lupinus angustifolius]|uniref:Uncharacterized protein n=1 Tax=Lupinus angustifolius TaxID=3871 RepID=A0A4P1R2V6_LUPAN|nr:PREDICTED: uncharacterized protein LOC109362263 [Lupinus angustifolius]OIV99994.1 hypothetical protein TanjilG_26332 [Lupinus angustifolius]